jgi:hypothetical protein
VPLSGGDTNLGVAIAGPSATGPATIVLEDELDSSRLLRGVVVPVGPGGFALTGPAEGFRALGPVSDDEPSDWHTQDFNGPGVTPFPSSIGNEFGAFDQDGTRIYGWRAGPNLVQTSSANPFVFFQPSAVGTFSLWQRLYAFEIYFETGANRNLTLRASATLSAGLRVSRLGDVWTLRVAGSNLSQTVNANPVSIGNLGPRWPCGASDIAGQGAAPGFDQRLDNNDFVLFINWFFEQDSRADRAGSGASAGADGVLDNNDFVKFIQDFFMAC